MNDTQKKYNARWHILGAGAIGCLFASYLRCSGYHVTLLLRDQQALQLFQRQGLQFICDGKKQVIDVDAAVASEYRDPIDYLLITVKAHDVVNVLSNVSACLQAQTQIILSHNGLGVYEEVIEKFSSLQPWMLVTTHAALLHAPFMVEHTGKGEIYIGKRINLEEEQQQEELQAAFFLKGMLINFVPDIINKQWSKVAINSCINPLTTIYHCKNGELLKSALLRQLMTKLCHEVVAVIRATDIYIDTHMLLENIFQVAKHTANNYSSMLCDVRRGRMTEIAYVNGYIVQRGKQFGLTLPYNEAVIQIIQCNLKC